MNLFTIIKSELLRTVAALQAAETLPADLHTGAITVEPPRDPAHGDVATNAAMVLAGQAKMKPREVAELIVEALNTAPIGSGRNSAAASSAAIAGEGLAASSSHPSPLTSPLPGGEGVLPLLSADIAGPGFINLRFAPGFWQQVIPVMLQAGIDYGDSTIGAGQRINVEYVSANPTGPLHIGHARGAVYGDALARLLAKAGYDVTKEYYINDAGAQVDVLARSAWLRYREACGEPVDIPEGLYPGEYLIPVGQALKAQYGERFLPAPGEQAPNSDSDAGEIMGIIKRFAIDAMMQRIRDDLAALGIFHEVFVSEQALHEADAVARTIETLRAKDLVYHGVLEPPKGKRPDDWEEREQLLFKSTDYGDDIDRALQKSDGSYTYFAADLAYAADKIERDYHSLIYMLGADHGGYKKRMEAAIAALSERRVQADIKLCQLVHLLRGGEPVKMSKRAGNFETVRDVTQAVGKDILRFMMLTRKNDMVMDFDLEKVKEQSKDNPVFYVQYAHARAQSLLRIGEAEMPEAAAASAQPAPDVLALLNTDAELALIRELAQFPRVVEAAAIAHEPHRIAYYLQELAARFHGLWNLGHGEASLRFLIRDDTQLTTARLALARAVAVGVASGLYILGVEPVDAL